MSRSKEQWIAETSGFRVGESQMAFQQRVQRIHKLRQDIQRGVATSEAIDEFAKLLGSDDENSVGE